VIKALLETISRRCDSLLGTSNYTAQRVDFAIRLLEARPPRFWGIVFNPRTLEIIMSGTSNTFTLTNLATPANATSFLGGVDESTGGTSIPTATVTSNNGSLVAIVGATTLTSTGEWQFGVYPTDTNPETNDEVDVNVALSDGSAVSFKFFINGVGATITEDASSAVKPWNGVVPQAGQPS
jgi:hypothetical protein